jgi:hypothetical protein
MRATLLALALVFLLGINAGRAANAPSAKPYYLVFDGKIEQIGPAPQRDSGNVDVYQLVRYHINHICSGRYEGADIIVDHLILRDDELKELKIGDKVCVVASKSNSISLRYNDGVIRTSSDTVNIFYTAKNMSIYSDTSKSCICRKK